MRSRHCPAENARRGKQNTIVTHLMRRRRSRSARPRARERAWGPPRRARTSARDEPPAVFDVRGMGSLSEPERREKPAGRGGCRRSAVKKDAEDSGREASVVRVRRTRVRARRDRGVRARVRETGSTRIVSRARARRGTRRAVNPRGRAMRVHAVRRAFVPARSQTRVPSTRGDSSRRARGAWCSANARYERCDASLTRVRSTLLCVRSGRASGARR